MLTSDKKTIRLSWILNTINRNWKTLKWNLERISVIAADQNFLSSKTSSDDENTTEIKIKTREYLPTD